MHVHYFKPEADDPMHESQQGRLVWQIGADSCRPWTFGHRAVVERGTQCMTRAADEGDLIGAGPKTDDIWRLHPPPYPRHMSSPGNQVGSAQGRPESGNSPDPRTGCLDNRKTILLPVIAAVQPVSTR